jgi:molybdopterin molybdotransferase
MLTVAEASQAIADSMPGFGDAPVALDEAAGRVLRQFVEAERDQPPFDRVTMDGIAIRFDAFAGGARSFRIEGTQHAGDAVMAISSDNGCIEIMTGGVLPSGADCIIPVERISISGGNATLEDGYSPDRHQFIHPQGSDYRKGHRVLSPGAVITPMDVAVIASCGLETVMVSRQPSVRVVSTGNELVPAGEPIEDHQVRMSNGPALVSMLVRQGFSDADHEHLIDEPSILEARLSRLLKKNDVLILSGGVSMGKADYVPEVLTGLGVDVVFHKISQRPGKPMWFGIGPENQAVFALPGNPVSTLVCCRQYVLPALLHACGRSVGSGESVRLAEPVTFKPALTCFMPARLAPGDDGLPVASPVKTNTSGDFAALSGTDGYVELERDETEFEAGRIVPLHRWTAP